MYELWSYIQMPYLPGHFNDEYISFILKLISALSTYVSRNNSKIFSLFHRAKSDCALPTY